jgi:hypothetical protein
MRMRIRLKSRQASTTRRRLNIAQLKNEEANNNLQHSVRDSLTRVINSGDFDHDQPIDVHWNHFKSEVYASAVDSLGVSSRPLKDWITHRTIDLAKRTEIARTNDQALYRQLRRQTSMSARSDRNAYWSELAGLMEQAAHVGDTRKLYRLIRSQCRSTNRTETIRDLSGTVITNFEERSSRWVEHFELLLNHGDPPSQNEFLEHPSTIAAPIYDSNCEPPTVVEIENVIKRLKNCKAPGEDGLTAEIFKACSPDISHWLHQIFSFAWIKEELPQDWSEAILLPFFKKGDKTLCKNYRGISLIDIAGKIFAIILLNRFMDSRERRTRKNQAGFRPGRSCTDQVFSLRLILEHRSCYQQPTITCFLDFAAAFDSIHRPSLWRILEADGLPPKLLRLIKLFYLKPGNRVLVNGELSNRFETRTGVRQGCPLSPIIFNFIIDWILRISLQNFSGVKISPRVSITDLDYADDIAILAESYIELQSVVERIDVVSRSVGLRINTDKSKVFSCCVNPSEKIPIQLGSEIMEEVGVFKYLGSNIRPDGQCTDEITCRIDAARKVFFQLRKPLWSRREIALQTKIKVFKSTVRSILLYCCESWPLKKEDERRLSVFDHWCLRFILRVRNIDRVSNTDVRRRCCNITPLSSVIQQSRLRWAGHVLRRPQTEITNLALNSEPDVNWRRRRGGQVKLWKDKLRTDLQSITGPSTFGLRRWNRDWLSIAGGLAENRSQWKAITRDILEAS